MSRRHGKHGAATWISLATLRSLYDRRV